MHGHPHREPPFDDQLVLQADRHAVQDPLRSKSLPVRPGAHFRCSIHTPRSHFCSALKYAFATAVAARGFDPEDAVLALSPRAGEHTLRTDDILDTIRREGSRVALVLFPGVQFYTGQFFAIREITAAARAQVRLPRPCDSVTV